MSVAGVAGAMTDSSGSAVSTILCCICGQCIQQNPSNMCANCLKTQVDITEGISKQVTIFFCKGCGRYQNQSWVVADLESREMMALCLKKIKGLDKRVKLVDAIFIWTEPHSRRIKVKLTVQKEVFTSSIMQQSFVVEFVVANQQCPDCQKSYTDHTWQACVQVRQKVKHKRTFYFLEQLIIKHGVAEGVQSVKEMPGGLDFFYLKQGGAARLQKFLAAVVPCTTKDSKKLISQDDHNNSYHYKYTVYVEMAPICKLDLCMLDKKLCLALGGVSPLTVCWKVSSTLHMIDPITLKIVEITSAQYWRYPFKSIMGHSQQVEYVVLDIELGESGNVFNKKTAMNEKTALAEVTVARSSDLGVNDQQFTCMTHLGNILKVGDLALGYDLTNAVLNDEVLKSFKRSGLPDCILVKKSYPKKNRATRRNWKLRNLKKEALDKPLKKTEEAKEEQDYEQFMRDVEEDPEMRKNILLYKKEQTELARKAEAKAAAESSEEEDLPALEGLLDSLDLKLDSGDPAGDQSAIDFTS